MTRFGILLRSQSHKNFNLRYLRNIKNRLLFYRLTYVLLLASAFPIFLTGQYFYLYFLVVLVFIRDFIFILEEVSINQSELKIRRWYLGGIIRTTRIFERDKIISLNY